MTTSSQDNWRLDNVRHLDCVRFRLAVYRLVSPTWDHDHCTACWAKFMETGGPEIETEGYVPADSEDPRTSSEWICRTCFDDLKVYMNWSSVEA